jgi:hypothetical protein
LQCARENADIWRQHPKHAGRWSMIVLERGTHPTFPPGPSWNPILHTETEFRAAVDKYIASIKATRGLTQPAEKRTGDEHFEWLALHHVGKSTYGEINQKYADANGKPDVPAISRAITETANLIGLTLRPGRGRKLR